MGSDSRSLHTREGALTGYVSTMGRHSRRIIRCMGLLLAALVLAACGGDEASSDAAEAPPVTDASATTAPAETTTTEAEETTEPASDPDAEPEEAEAEEAAADGAREASGYDGFELTDLGDGWLEVGHVPDGGEEPCQCSDGSEWNFYVREAADPSAQVMVMFEGGGACWSAVTCLPEAGFYKQTVSDERDGYDSSALTEIGGVFDADNPANPLADYTVVFVPYCTGDVHLGNAVVTYSEQATVQHRGAVNARVAMDWVVQQYGDVEDLFVTGMSAGSVPAPMYGGVLADELPDARVTTLSDASGGYPTTPEVGAIIEQNGALDMLPPWDEFDVDTPAELGIPTLLWRTAQHNPNITQARFDNAYDDVQELFRQVLGVPADDLFADLVAIDAEIDEMGRPVASWISPGDAHTILMDDRLYTEEVDGSSFIDWLTDLVEGRPVDDVFCTECVGE